MPKLPSISGEQAVKCFEKLGYQVIRQRGSHIQMHHKFDKTKKADNYSPPQNAWQRITPQIDS